MPKLSLKLDYENGIVYFITEDEKTGMLSTEGINYNTDKEKLKNLEEKYHEFISEDDWVALAYFGKDMARKELEEAINNAISELGEDEVIEIFRNANFKDDVIDDPKCPFCEEAIYELVQVYSNPLASKYNKLNNFLSHSIEEIGCDGCGAVWHSIESYYHSVKRESENKLKDGDE
jgi:hypothetical protein